MFQQLCFSIYGSASVIQHLCFSTYVSLLCCSICVRICVAASVFASNSRVSASMFQHVRFIFCVAASVFAFVLQHLCSHLCCSICVRFQQSCFSIYVSASVIQYLCFSTYVSLLCCSIGVAASVFVLVLQHLCSHLCCNICVRFQQSCFSIYVLTLVRAP
jgi:hypothetical protein